jgi:hypothetical protein
MIQSARQPFHFFFFVLSTKYPRMCVPAHGRVEVWAIVGHGGGVEDHEHQGARAARPALLTLVHVTTRTGAAAREDNTKQNSTGQPTSSDAHRKM